MTATEMIRGLVGDSTQYIIMEHFVGVSLVVVRQRDVWESNP